MKHEQIILDIPDAPRHESLFCIFLIILNKLLCRATAQTTSIGKQDTYIHHGAVRGAWNFWMHGLSQHADVGGFLLLDPVVAWCREGLGYAGGNQQHNKSQRPRQNASGIRQLYDSINHVD